METRQGAVVLAYNIQREELLPSEKAFAYKMKLEAMKRQGVRTDLTLSQNETKLRSDEVLSKQVGESRAQVQRFVRLTELIPELLDLVDNKKLQFTVGFIFTLLIIATAYCYHDWVQVAFLFALSVILYLILFAGVFVDTVLDMTRECIIDFILS